MYLLGHVGLTLLAGLGLRRWWPLPLAWLAVGALLPDIVDKPLGHLVLGWDAGRLFAHTLLFAVALVAVAALACARFPRVGMPLAALALGSAGHLLLDQIWREPAVLYWPLLGPMPRGHWAPSEYVVAATNSPYLWVTEALGAAALVAVLWAQRAQMAVALRGGPAAWRPWRGAPAILRADDAEK